MTILTDGAASMQPRKNRYSYDLETGERWEETLTSYLKANGLNASRLCQRFYPAYKLRDYRLARKCRLASGRTDRGQGWDGGLLRPYQIDLRLKLTKTQQKHIEVKCLTGTAFRADWVHIGKVEKYRDKQLPVNWVCLINEDTGEAWVCPPARMWQAKPALRGDGQDIAVPRAKLSPIDAWIVLYRLFYLEDPTTLD